MVGLFGGWDAQTEWVIIRVFGCVGCEWRLGRQTSGDHC